MRPTRTLQALAALVVGLGTLVASAVPAPAAVHDYDIDVDELAVDFFDSTSMTPWFSVAWATDHQCGSDSTLQIDDVALTTTWTIELSGVFSVFGSWRKYTLTLTVTTEYGGTGDPYALFASEGTLHLALEAVSGATDCSPDSGVLCNVVSDDYLPDLSVEGLLEANGHGVSGLTPSDTSTLEGGTGSIDVYGSPEGCGFVFFVNGGRVELLLEASGFS